MNTTIVRNENRRWLYALFGLLLLPSLGLLCPARLDGAPSVRPDDPSTCPADPSVCAFASLLEQSLFAGDTDPIIALMEAREFVCPGPEPRDVGDPFPVCDGSDPDERRTGYVVGFLHSHGGAFSAERLQAFLHTWITSSLNDDVDDFGSGAAQLVSIGCPGILPEEGASCRDRFTVVFSSLQLPPDARMPLRQQLVFHVDQAGDTPGITHVQSGLVLPPDLTTVLQGGHVQSAVSPVLGAPSGTFFVWPR